MKKTILAAFAVLALATATHAGDAETWVSYNSAKVEAKAAMADLEAGNTATAALSRALVAFASTSASAAALGRKDILAWQLNNVGFAYITWFKHAGYTKAMRDLEAIPAGKTKPAAIAAAKAELKPVFDTIELPAKSALDSAEAVGSTDEVFQATLKSNQGFLVWVRGFLDKK